MFIYKINVFLDTDNYDGCFSLNFLDLWLSCYGYFGKILVIIASNISTPSSLPFPSLFQSFTVTALKKNNQIFVLYFLVILFYFLLLCMSVCVCVFTPCFCLASMEAKRGCLMEAKRGCLITWNQNYIDGWDLHADAQN